MRFFDVSLSGWIRPQALVTCLVILVVWGDRSTNGQGVIIRRDRGVLTQQSTSSVDLPADRTMGRGIDRAKERISAREYSQAIRFLDEVLANEQDSFVAVGERGEHVGLKETASRMIRDLPAAGRELYESTFGPVARKKLQEAVETGNIVGMREVSRRYFYTPAGREASLLVAQYEADSGRHLSANLIYRELLQSTEAVEQLNPQLALLAARSALALGETEDADEWLASIETSPGSPIRIAGRDELLSTATKSPVSWFEKVVGNVRTAVQAAEDQWLMPRGNASRNGHALGGLPHVRVRWEARLLSHPQFEDYHDEFWAALENRRQPLPTAGTPLAIGDTIVTTTAQNVVAVDFRTGKRIWQTQPQRISEFENLLNSSVQPGQFDNGFQPVQAFARRIWDDYLYNSISSDGERVFVIRDLRLPSFEQPDPWAMQFRAELNDEQAHANRLCAYDMATQGKLVWELDGASVDGDLAGAYFLGAPLVVDERLYCLAEIKSAIHLVAIDRGNGRVAWLQQLAGLQNSIDLDPLRRLQAAMPSYDSGMLVCPTGAGVVIGVNLEKNALAWAYEYESLRNPIAFMRRSHQGHMVQQGGHWIEEGAVLANGRVLLAPPESEFLHCLDLVTGKLLWKRERGDGFYVAGVEDGKVLIVGLHGFSQVSLEDGKPTWPEQNVAYPGNAMPSGRGFFSSNKYFIPLSNAEIIAVDLANGEIVERTRSRSGVVLGNLVAHKGAILSQNGKFLDCFDQINVLREYTETRLAEYPDDVDALRTLGELTYNDGQLGRAIQLLERAYKISSNEPRTREVLGECLLEALQKDFSTYHDSLPRLREIVSDSPDRVLDLLRIEAEGLLYLGKPWESFEACLRMFGADFDMHSLTQVAPSHQATVTNWLAAQTADIWKHASSEVRARIVDRLSEMLAQLPEGTEGRGEFMRAFGRISDVIEPELLIEARSLVNQDRLLAAQQLYLSLRHGPDAIRVEAVGALSQLLAARGYESLTTYFNGQLAGPLSNAKTVEGKTGAQLLELNDSVLSTPTLRWPYGVVEVVQPPQTNQVASRRAQVPMVEVRLEQTDEVLGRCNVFFSSRIGELAIQDSYGREVFRQTLGEEERQIFDQRGIYGASRGNLVVLSLGQQITAVDTLSRTSDGNPVLWRKSMVRSQADRFRSQSQTMRNADRPGSHRAPRSHTDERWVGVLGPITHDSVVYQDERGLHCVDLLTGEPKWVRTDSPNACHLFGDDEVVVAVDEGSGKARVFSTIDGRDLGAVEIPRWQEQLASRGTTVIAWKRLPGGDYQLALIDALSGEVAWHKEFAGGSQVDVVLNRYVGVVEPTGRYVVVDAIDGNLVVDYKSTPISSLRALHLFAGTDHFVLAAEAKISGNRDRTRAPFHFFDAVLFDGELMVFDADTGEALWSRPAEVREQSLMLSQPVDVPVIAFAGNKRRQDATGSHQLINMLVLEKASGRVLLADENLPPSPNHCAVSADPENSVVSVEMINRLVRFQFTNKPRAPEPPATYDATTAEKDGPQGIYRIFQRLGGSQ